MKVSPMRAANLGLGLAPEDNDLDVRVVAPAGFQLEPALQGCLPLGVSERLRAKKDLALRSTVDDHEVLHVSQPDLSGD